MNKVTFKELEANRSKKLTLLNTKECEKVSGGASAFLWHLYCYFRR